MHRGKRESGAVLERKRLPFREGPPAGGYFESLWRRKWLNT